MGPYAPKMKRVFGPRNGHWLEILIALTGNVEIVKNGTEAT